MMKCFCIFRLKAKIPCNACERCAGEGWRGFNVVSKHFDTENERFMVGIITAGAALGHNVAYLQQKIYERTGGADMLQRQFA